VWIARTDDMTASLQRSNALADEGSSPSSMSDLDIAYLDEQFATLEALAAHHGRPMGRTRHFIWLETLPRPSYVLDDGTEYVPFDYFELLDEAGAAECVESLFMFRYRGAALANGMDPGDAEAVWTSYLTGIYGVCLMCVTPETIARKSSLVGLVGSLLAEPVGGDSHWQSRLERAVDELDGLERPFAPDLDRAGRFGRLPTRDLLVARGRERLKCERGRA
jgi:hypothetical protein